MNSPSGVTEIEISTFMPDGCKICKVISNS